MANLAPVIRQRFFDSNGVPLADGKLWSYEAGTTTPLATYSDDILTPNTNPIILDSEGYCDVWISNRSYKFVLMDLNNVVQWTKDNISIPQVENGFTTGDIKLSLKNVADSGWVLMDDKSIGSAASSATGRANADTEDLYTLIWENVSNSYAPVSSGRGGSAAADFAANKTLTLPRSLGRALAVAGAGSGLTSRALGEYLGSETHVLTESEMPSHTHVQNAHTHIQNSHSHAIQTRSTTGADNQPIGQSGGGTASGTTDSTTPTNQDATAVNQDTGGDAAHTNMQPTLFLKMMIKL